MDDSTLMTQGANLLGTLRGVVGDVLQFRLLDKKIDAEIARPFFVNDPTGQYALGANGQIYVRGAPAGLGLAGSDLSSLLVIGLLIGGVFLAVNALKG